MKNILLLLMVCISMAASAQITKVSIQASGLTCSMCSNSINKALKTLDFVEKIESDIKTYTFVLSFKPNSTVDFGAIKKKVEGAGFSVSSFIATVLFSNLQVQYNQPVTIGSNSVLIINSNVSTLNGTRQIKVVDKGFVSAEEYRKSHFPVSSPGTYRVTI